MKIEILGSGCNKCKTLEETVRKAVKNLGIRAEIDHVSDIVKIVEYGVMMTPAIAIDGNIVIEGKVPTQKETETIIAKFK